MGGPRQLPSHIIAGIQEGEITGGVCKGNRWVSNAVAGLQGSWRHNGKRQERGDIEMDTRRGLKGRTLRFLGHEGVSSITWKDGLEELTPGALR